MAGGAVFTGAASTPSTTPVGAEVAVAVPWELAAVSASRRVEPSSAAASV